MVEDANSNQKKIKTGILLFLIFASTNAKPSLIENIKTTCPNIDLTPRDDVLITMNMMSKLGIVVLEPDQKLCFFGRLLDGLTLPKPITMQIPILKGLLTWYSPCLMVYDGYYKVDNVCFTQREKQFLEAYIQSIGTSMKPIHSPESRPQRKAFLKHKKSHAVSYMKR